MTKNVTQYVVKNSSVEATFFNYNKALDYQKILSNSIIESNNVLISTRSKVEQLKLDYDFGNDLVFMFLEDNRNDPNITTIQSIDIMSRFDNISKLLRFGDIKMAKHLIEQEVVDSVVFTQERKSKYLNLINAHLEEALIYAE